METTKLITPCWSAAEYEKSGRFVAQLAGGVLNLLAPARGESILDVGCGDGVLTLEIQSRGADVIGVDSSPELLNAAIDRGVDARQMDGEHLEFQHSFDAVFSNAALHWMLNQDRVLAGVHKALKPHGRFVAECGGHGNIAAIRAALQSVMADFGIDAERAAHNVFFTAAEYSSLLTQHGFHVEFIDLIPRPTLLPGGMDAWLRTFRSSLLGALDPEQRARVTERVSELLRPVLCTRAGDWYADYVRLRFRAHVQ